MFVNIWIGVREEAHQAIKTRLAWDEDKQGPYTGGVTTQEHRLFKFMVDQGTVENLFKVNRVGLKNWSLWSISFDEPGNVLQKVKTALDTLKVDRSTMIVVAGAWHWDGRQVGTRFASNGTTILGTPTYPIPLAQLLKFMPDDVTFDSLGNETGRTVATILSDVNLLLGQSPRRFA